MNGKMYADKAEYVKGMMPTLEAMEDFDYIKYARSDMQEYIKIADKLGGYVFIDVTGYEKGDILKDVAKIILSEEKEHHMPAGVILDRAKLRQIAPLFR